MKRSALTLVELLIVIAIIGLLVAFLLPSVRSAREPARRNQCMNNLKQISIALQHYEENHGAFPPAYTTDAEGKPLHSWRTLILPYLEQRALYDSIDLTKPWDDPANAAAFRKSLDIFQCPSSPQKLDNRTKYQAVVTPESCLRPGESRKLSDITDGAGHTFMVIEVDEEHAAPWMAPVDADEKVVLGLGGPGSTLPHPGGTLAAYADGRVSFINSDLAEPQRRALISIAGNDKELLIGEE